MKPVNDLSPAALNRELAEALGWEHRAVEYDGMIIDYWSHPTVREHWPEQPGLKGVPEFTEDIRAAIWAVEQVAPTGSKRWWGVKSLSPMSGYTATIWRANGYGGLAIACFDADSPALAMARAALAAMREMEVTK